MSYAKAVDANQKQIVSDLRLLGYKVTILSRAGGGIPDLVVADDSRMVWVEVKMPGAKLTPDEREFFELWPEELRIIAYGAEDVFAWFDKR